LCFSCVFRTFYIFILFFCILGFYTFISAVLLFYGSQLDGNREMNMMTMMIDIPYEDTTRIIASKPSAD